MNRIYVYLMMLTVIVGLSITSCQRTPRPPGDIPMYTFPPQNNQQVTTPEPKASINPSPKDKNGEYIIRNIVVDERNTIFSIGIPSGQREQTEISAQKPIDFWFEYLPAEAKLEVNGIEVQRDPFHWETKIRYTTSVTRFDYQITNATGNAISYNLHLVPSQAGQSVTVVVRQRWIP